MNKGLLLPLMIVLTALALHVMPAAVQAQNGAPLHRIQAVVDGLASTRHAYRADLLLRDQAGVVTSRTDLNTQNLAMEVAPDCALDEASINVLLAPLGLSIRCTRREEAGNAPFRHLGTGPCELEMHGR